MIWFTEIRSCRQLIIGIQCVFLNAERRPKKKRFDYKLITLAKHNHVWVHLVLPTYIIYRYFIIAIRKQNVRYSSAAAIQNRSLSYIVYTYVF